MLPLTAPRGLGPVSVRPPQLLPAQKLVLQALVGILFPVTPRKVSAQPHLGSATSNVPHVPICPHAASAFSQFLIYSCVARVTNVSTGCSMYHSMGPHQRGNLCSNFLIFKHLWATEHPLGARAAPRQVLRVSQCVKSRGPCPGGANTFARADTAPLSSLGPGTGHGLFGSSSTDSLMSLRGLPVLLRGVLPGQTRSAIPSAATPGQSWKPAMLGTTAPVSAWPHSMHDTTP